MSSTRPLHEADVDRLVALGAELFKQTPREAAAASSARKRTFANTNSAAASAASSIRTPVPSDFENLPHHRDLALLSDAVATLCVPERGPEHSYAVCIRPTARAIQVFLSRNDTSCRGDAGAGAGAGADGVVDYDGLVTYLRRVWALLTQISKQAFKARLRNRATSAQRAEARDQDQDQRDGPAKGGGGSASDEVMTLIAEPFRELMREVYVYSERKFRARLEKRWAEFDAFCARARKTDRRGKALVRSFFAVAASSRGGGMLRPAHFEALDNIHLLLDYCRKELLDGAKESGNKSIEEIAEKMEWAYGFAVELADQVELKEEKFWVPAEDMADFLKQAPDEPPFPLQRFLHKVTAFSRAIDTLVNFAISPANRFYFELGLSIVPVPVKTVTCDLTASRTPWSTVFDDALSALGEKANAATITSLHSHIESLEKTYPHDKENTVTSSIHCECALAIHLLKRLHRSRRFPNSINNGLQITERIYLGLSKPPCTPCTAFLYTLSNTTTATSFRIKFYTRPSRGRWQMPSSAPSTSATSSPERRPESAVVWLTPRLSDFGLDGVFALHRDARQPEGEGPGEHDLVASLHRSMKKALLREVKRRRLLVRSTGDGTGKGKAYHSKGRVKGKSKAKASSVAVSTSSPSASASTSDSASSPVPASVSVPVSVRPVPRVTRGWRSRFSHLI
ncbi:hypothetical protein VTO42DRAFT_782 [Malbranchea cinnamomea]